MRWIESLDSYLKCFASRLYPESDSTACEDEKNRHLLLGGMSEVEVPDDDDDTAKEGAPPIPDFSWRDQDMTTYMTDALDQMRKHKHFCDVVLQVRLRVAFDRVMISGKGVFPDQ